MNELKEYLHTNFPGLVLKPSLYWQWDIGIHFVLGEDIYQFKDGTDKLNLNRFERVYSQALSIFTDVFSEQDEIFLVTNVYRRKKNQDRRNQVKIYDRYVKNKDFKIHLKHETLPYMFDEEEADDYYTSQFSLKCRKQDINYQSIIKATCNEDFPLQPKLARKYDRYYPDVFFVNLTQNVIFFIYDDRGCEVIASNKETIRPLYEKYSEWIDENY